MIAQNVFHKSCGEGPRKWIDWRGTQKKINNERGIFSNERKKIKDVMQLCSMFCLPFIKNTQVLVPGWEFSVFTHFFGDALTRGIVNFVLPFTVSEKQEETQTKTKKKKTSITRSYSRTRNLRGFLGKKKKIIKEHTHFTTPPLSIISSKLLCPTIFKNKMLLFL